VASNATMHLKHALLVGAAPGLTPPENKQSPLHQPVAAAPQSHQVQRTQSPQPPQQPVQPVAPLPQSLFQAQPIVAVQQHQQIAVTSADIDMAARKINEERFHELNQIQLQLLSVEKSLSNLAIREEGAKDSLSQVMGLRVRIKARMEELVMPRPAASTPKAVAPPLPVPIVPAKPTCALQGCTLEGIYICTGCREAYYCGAVHQK